jgi:hypothetical protein
MVESLPSDNKNCESLRKGWRGLSGHAALLARCQRLFRDYGKVRFDVQGNCEKCDRCAMSATGQACRTLGTTATPLLTAAYSLMRRYLLKAAALLRVCRYPLNFFHRLLLGYQLQVSGLQEAENCPPAARPDSPRSLPARPSFTETETERALHRHIRRSKFCGCWRRRHHPCGLLDAKET